MNREIKATQKINETAAHREKMNTVFVGHVDHGKSTVLGRLLVDTGSLPDGKLEQVKANCERTSRPFEYAFLIDALKDEQSQGITIDAARVFFKTEKRDYIIIDAPGHIEFLKNMITGAAHAEAALLVIDASEGVQENSRRHGYMLSMLGVSQIAVIINKMDLVDYSEKVYNGIVDEYCEFLKGINIDTDDFIPVSGIEGDNITPGKNRMPWYTGKSVLEVLDDFKNREELPDMPYRMPVQDVYKFTRFGDKRRIVAGTVQSGSVSVGDEVLFFPSGKKSRVASIEEFNRDPGTTRSAPYPVGYTLDEQIYIKRGELAVRADEKQPLVSSMIQVSLFWLGRKPLVKDRDYILKIGSVKVPMRLHDITKVIDASELPKFETKEMVERHEVAECTLALSRPIAFDRADENQYTSRFVIVDDYEISGGGIIQDEVDDRQAELRHKVLLRNYKWERSGIPLEDRFERFGQKSRLIFITGHKDCGKKTIARSLERSLFNEGRIVYFLGIGNILYGLDADIKGINSEDRREEHIRRLAEMAHIMLETGSILIVTAVDLTEDDLEIIRASVNPEMIDVFWVGKDGSDGLRYTHRLECDADSNSTVEIIKDYLHDKGVIFRP